MEDSRRQGARREHGAKMRENLKRIQGVCVHDAIEQIREKLRAFDEAIDRGDAPPLFEVDVIFRDPRRPYLLPPYEFQVDDHGDVFLVGLDIQGRALAVPINWSPAEMELFLAAAKGRRYRISLRSFQERPDGMGRPKAKTVTSMVSRMREEIREKIQPLPWVSCRAGEAISFAKESDGHVFRIHVDVTLGGRASRTSTPC